MQIWKAFQFCNASSGLGTGDGLAYDRSMTAAVLPSVLGRVSLRMASSLDLDEVLGEITRGLVSELDAAMARIWLLRAGTPHELHLVASAGLSERLDGRQSKIPVGQLKIGEIASTRERVCSTELQTDPRFVDKAWIHEHGLHTFAGYPLECGGELLGVLAMFARRSLAAAELEQLAIFAAQASIAIKNAGLFAEVTELTRRLEAENSYLREVLHEDTPYGLVGESESFKRAMREVERVAPTTSTVLLQGETGTGKELFARAIHDMSHQRRGALVKVNCAALAPTLIESELFGHEKGAFTGAMHRRVGRFELARGGTLFLDEVSELPLEAQAKLLRVLQEHEVERVGSTQAIPIDARIVAATNRDLQAEMRAGRFRPDLYFRLNVFPVRVPPLRDRRDDIPLLAESFLEALATRLGQKPKTLDAEALGYLQAYAWPGNVRELQNVLERAAILGSGSAITIAELPELSCEHAIAEAAGPADERPLREQLVEFERGLLVDALRRAGGNQTKAAARLGLSRATLQYKLKVFGVA